MEFIKLFIALSQQRIRYLVCGGLAINIYGIPRSTADIDLVLDLEKANVASFLEVLTKLGYVKHLPISLEELIDKTKREEFIRDKNLIAYSFYNSTNNVMTMDVLIDTPLEFENMWNSREIRSVIGEDINIVSISDLIAMKKYAGRLQDEKDIILLSKMLKNEK